MAKIKILSWFCTVSKLTPTEVNGIELQHVIMLISVFAGDLRKWHLLGAYRHVRFLYKCLLRIQYGLRRPIFHKTFHLGYKEIPDINIIRNKREHTHTVA